MGLTNKAASWELQKVAIGTWSGNEAPNALQGSGGQELVKSSCFPAAWHSLLDGTAA